MDPTLFAWSFSSFAKAAEVWGQSLGLAPYGRAMVALSSGFVGSPHPTNIEQASELLAGAHACATCIASLIETYEGLSQVRPLLESHTENGPVLGLAWGSDSTLRFEVDGWSVRVGASFSRGLHRATQAAGYPGRGV